MRSSTSSSRYGTRTSRDASMLARSVFTRQFSLRYVSRSVRISTSVVESLSLSRARLPRAQKYAVHFRGILVGTPRNWRSLCGRPEVSVPGPAKRSSRCDDKMCACTPAPRPRGRQIWRRVRDAASSKWAARSIGRAQRYFGITAEHFVAAISGERHLDVALASMRATGHTLARTRDRKTVRRGRPISSSSDSAV